MADKTAQLAKLSHMSQLPATTFLHTSGGSLLIRRRSRDQQAHAAIAPATGGSVGYPIVRTRSCPAGAEHGPFESENESERDHENENESENESGNESASSTSSSCSTTAAKSSDAVRTRPGAHKLKFQDQQYKNKRKGTTIAHHHLVHVLVPALAVDDVKPTTDAQSSHSGPIRTRSSRRYTWGSVMSEEGTPFTLTLPDRDVSTSEDSGVESGVDSARDERDTNTATTSQGSGSGRRRRPRGRSLQLAQGAIDPELTPKSGPLRRSKENEDVQLPSREGKDKGKTSKAKEPKRPSTPKTPKLRLKTSADNLSTTGASGGSSTGSGSDDESRGAREKLDKKSSKERKREDSKREKRERKQLKAEKKKGDKESSEAESVAAAASQQPIVVRRKLSLNLDGLPKSPRGGISVQSLLRVGDHVWAADSSGRITVFNPKGEVEKVIVVCTGRLYSMLLVDKKHVWVSAEDSIIRVYHAAKYKKEKDLQSHRSMVRCMEVIRQPDDKVQVWSGDVEGNIIVWDPQKLKKEAEFCVQFGEAIFCIVALPHCVWVSAGGELYRVNLRKLEVETGWTAHERPITDLLYLPEENVVFSCAGDGIIRVWKDHYTGLENHSSLQSEASLRPASLLRELTSSINVSALCPASPRSGLRICAGHIDGAISLWDSDFKEVSRVNCDASAFAGIRYLLSIRPEDGGKASSRKLGETLWSATRDGSICVWDWTGHVATPTTQ